MYLKLTNKTVEKYPYSIGQLTVDNPQTSFPANPSDETLAEWGVFKVAATPRPEVDHTKNVVEGQPKLVGGEWVQVWVVSDASAEEVEQRTNEKAASVRSERNRLIAECDWTQLSDAPLNSLQKADWTQYRQELRDVPQQVGFPHEVVWPNKP